MLSYISKAIADGNKDGWFGWYKTAKLVDGEKVEVWENKYHDKDVLAKHKPMLAGMFKFKDTHGLPFDMIYKELERKGSRVELFHWCLEAMHAGHGIRGVKAELKATLPEEQHKLVDFFADLAYGELSYSKFKEMEEQYA